MEINTVNLTYRQTLADEAANKRQRKQRHYPSGACAILSNGKFVGKCRRATWYEWYGEAKTNPPDAPALFKMRVGDMIHEHLDDLLNRALLGENWKVDKFGGENGSISEGIGAETALVWQPEGLKYPFSGRLDKRLISPSGMRIAAEWKSTYGRGSDDVKANGPKEDALLQCACYLEQDVFPVDEVVNMYAARDSGYLQGFAISKSNDGLLLEWMGSTKVTFSPINFEMIKTATAELEEFLENPVPPPRDYGPDNPDKANKWRCEYCSYKNTCFK